MLEIIFDVAIIIISVIAIFAILKIWRGSKFTLPDGTEL